MRRVCSVIRHISHHIALCVWFAFHCQGHFWMIRPKTLSLLTCFWQMSNVVAQCQRLQAGVLIRCCLDSYAIGRGRQMLPSYSFSPHDMICTFLKLACLIEVAGFWRYCMYCCCSAVDDDCSVCEQRALSQQLTAVICSSRATWRFYTKKQWRFHTMALLSHLLF